MYSDDDLSDSSANPIDLPSSIDIDENDSVQELETSTGKL